MKKDKKKQKAKPTIEKLVVLMPLHAWCRGTGLAACPGKIRAGAEDPLPPQCSHTAVVREPGTCPFSAPVSAATGISRYTETETSLFCDTEKHLDSFLMKGDFHLLFFAQPY